VPEASVIPTGGRVEVFVHREPVDMRKQYDGLWGLVVALGRSPFDGALYAFIGKTRKRAKVLWWDGTGVVVLCKRLDKGHFVAPWTRPGRGPLMLTASELALLLEGSELVGRVRLSPEPWTPAQASAGR
jgi:transposase